MAKAELKTKQTEQSVAEFLGSVSDDKMRQASWKILELMQAATQAEPKMWGEGIIGFGQYHYKHASGREGDWFLTGFSPRKQNLTLYIMTGFDQYETLLGKLGKYKTGKNCLYISTLEDVDKKVLTSLIIKSVQRSKVI